MSERGLLIVFSSTSGVGKGTVRQEIFQRQIINLNIQFQ